MTQYCFKLLIYYYFWVSSRIKSQNIRTDSPTYMSEIGKYFGFYHDSLLPLWTGIISDGWRVHGGVIGYQRLGPYICPHYNDLWPKNGERTILATIRRLRHVSQCCVNAAGNGVNAAAWGPSLSPHWGDRKCGQEYFWRLHILDIEWRQSDGNQYSTNESTARWIEFKSIIKYGTNEHRSIYITG